MSEKVRRASGTLAIYTRYKGAHAPETIEARRALAAAKLEAYVAQIVATAPPLTPTQRDLIVRLLVGAR